MALAGRLGAFFVGFGVASVFASKVVVDAVHQSKQDIDKATADLAKRVAALEKQHGAPQVSSN